MPVWRVVDTGAATGTINMAVDEAMLLELAAGRVPPTIRFYRWWPAAVSIGYFQDLEKELDLDACRQTGVDWVRRLTGGRAILHDAELTYSIVANQDDPAVSGTIVESYLKISRGILEALQSMGVPAEMVARPAKGGHGTAACFDAPSWYEIVVDGRKLVGSAQVRKHGVLLQHGSLPLTMDAEKFFSLLRMPNQRVRERLVREFQRKACSLEEALGRPVTYDATRKALEKGLAKMLGITLEPGPLTKGEMELAEQLAKEKYATDGWNFKSR